MVTASRPAHADAVHHFDRSLLAEAPNVSALRTELARFAAAHGAHRETTWRMQIAAGEALNNVVMHAYRGGRVGEMRVRADADGAGGFDVAVSDAGCGFAPREDSPGAGMGVSLMHDAATRVSIRRAHRTERGDGTLVLLHFDP